MIARWSFWNVSPRKPGLNDTDSEPHEFPARALAQRSQFPRTPTSPENASALMALCGSLYRLAKDVNFDAIVTYATRLRREVGESS